MSRLLRYTALIHAVLAAVVGALMLIIPGRFLLALGWAPIDPIVSRLLGAALLALAWSSFRCWRAREWRQVAIVVELEIVFTVLGCVGLLRHLLAARYPLIVWALFAVLAAFALSWLASLAVRRRA